MLGEQGAKACAAARWKTSSSPAPPAGRRWAGPRSRSTIDNSDGALPIEYAEVSITRGCFATAPASTRSTARPCRLLDIQELLSDSGIGREMHVIVGQGQLDAVLQARPEDRRGFIEEAAGVLKHRKRKEKALRKLEAMQANLTRVTDLTGELRRQLKPLGSRPRSPGERPACRPTCATPGCGCWPTTSSEPAGRSSRNWLTRRFAHPAGRGRGRSGRSPRAQAELEAAAGEQAAGWPRAQEVWYRLSGVRERLRGRRSRRSAAAESFP